MTHSTKQLERTALRGMVLQEAPEVRQARPPHFFPDGRPTPEEPRRWTRTLIQSDMPDLSWATRLAHRAECTARLKRPRRRCQRRSPRPPPPTAISRVGGGEMPGTTERQPLHLRGSQPQNKGMPSEFGSDERLVFPIAPSGWSLDFCNKWTIYDKVCIVFYKGAVLL